MKFNFKKIMSVAATALMLGSTAAAATYPAPFVESGTAAGAVIVGANAASSDWSAAIDLSQGLNNLVTTTTGTTGGSVTGEAAPLFTSGTKLYINDSLNAVKSALTESDLATILADGTFSGNVDATYTQTITLGPYSQIVYDKIPTSSDDPAFGVAFSTTSNYVLYNASVTFNKEVVLADAESEGEDLVMFGQSFTIAASTDTDTLVLLKEAEKLSLDSETNPSQEVTVAGETYTVELVSASDTAATIKVTDSSGASTSKEINEAASKKVQGLTVAVQTADETNLKLSANVIAGAEKVTLEQGNNVKIGEDDTIIDGTIVTFTDSARSNTTLSKITIGVNAPNSDADSIKPGSVFADPVFGSFKLDFAGLNIPEESTAREDVKVTPSGDDKMQVTFTSHTGDTKTLQFAKNLTDRINMEYSDGRNITVVENAIIYKNDYVVVGNEDEGYLLKLTSVSNQSGTTYSSDKVELTDVMTDTTYTGTITSKGAGEINIGGKVYNFKYNGTSSADSNAVMLDYPDSATGKVIVYPTIETSKGAKLFFYEPVTINLNDIGGTFNTIDATGVNCSSLVFPDGDGYTEKAVTLDAIGGTFSVGGVQIEPNQNSSVQSIGQLSYNFTAGNTTGADLDTKVKIYLQEPTDVSSGGVQRYVPVYDPAIVIFEEKDDNTQYNAVIVSLESGATSDDGLGVNDVSRTWGADGAMTAKTGVVDWDAEHSLYTDSKKQKEADLWGTVALVDKSDSDQNSATLSYPDEQVYAQVYIAEEAAAISAAAATSGAGGKVLVVKDSESTSVKDKNLVVVGGSCINTVAAKMLESDTPLCGAEFTEKTGTEAGKFLVKTMVSPYNADKIAMLVAGYNAEDTIESVDALAMGGLSTDLGTKVY